MNRRIVINLGVFAVLAVVMTVWAMANLLSVHPFAQPVRITAEFSDAAGIRTDSEVTYLGTHAGMVRDVKATATGALVTFELEPGFKVPREATAHVWRKSAIGEQYVDLAPPAKSGAETPRNGDTIPLARTAVPIEFSTFLKSASGLVASLDPADVRTVVHELAAGLKGRTADLRALIDGSDRLSAALAARTTEIDRLLANTTRVTHVFAMHAASVRSTLSDLRAISASLRDAHLDLGPLVARGNALLDQLVPLVSEHEGDLSCTLQALQTVVDMAATPSHLAGIAPALRDLPDALGQVMKASDIDPDSNGFQRRWLRVGLVLNFASGPKQFTPALPPAPAIAAVPRCAERPASALAPLASHQAPAGNAGSSASLVVLFAYVSGTVLRALRRRKES